MSGSLSAERPLAGLKVVEFSHMVMGPLVGVVLGDLGATVIKVEPLEGDATRQLLGSGAGYFPMYNRNKRSIRLDLKSEGGLCVARRLADWADVLIENFRPGAMAKLGLDRLKLQETNAGLIYCSAKGFLAGPYEHRAALDEVAQMMGGLAYMTGPPGRPLRAGASVIDVTGGLFGVIGILAALEQRHRTGKGQSVDCSLFETTAFLVGQHMAQKAVTGVSAAPMPARTSAWAVYDVFDALDEEQVFVGVVSDAQWKSLCNTFALDDWAADPALATNNQRVNARDVIIPRLQALFAATPKAALLERLEQAGLPFAPITRPDDLMDDPHLAASGGLLDVKLADGAMAKLPALPLRMNARGFGVELDPPAPGEQSLEVLKTVLGLEDQEVERLFAAHAAA
jgi:crotonobetainyl-CoA:carnitine CoA-transferase CaiB-like acyl-CoA transferase